MLDADVAGMVADADQSVRSGDLELATLGDEAFDALFAQERIEVDEGALQALLPGMRALAAAGLADLSPEGFVLGQTAEFLRHAVTGPLTRLLWLPGPDSGFGFSTWSMVTPATVVHHAWDEMGLHTFRLRNLRSALSHALGSALPTTTEADSTTDSGITREMDDAKISDFLEELSTTHSVGSIQVLPTSSLDGSRAAATVVLIATAAGRDHVVVIARADQQAAQVTVGMTRQALRASLLSSLTTQ